MPNDPPQLRKFGDHAATRAAIFAGALDAVRKLAPVENTRYRLSIEHPHYAPGEDFSAAEHKRAILEGRSLTRRLVGTYVLTDKATGNVVDKRRMTVSAIPYLTDHGVFRHDGNPLVIAHQLRLLPGIYVRKTQAGQTEAHLQFLPGQGVSHHVHLDPKTGVFKTRIGQAEIPTLPLLRTLGIPDERIKQAWGEELFNRNLKAEKPQHLDKYWEKFGPPGPRPDGLDVRQALKDTLGKYPLDPWVVQRTLGLSTSNYGGEALLAATRKVRAVARKEAEPDDRDHPAFSAIMGPEHTLPERLARSGPLLAKALWAATNTGSLKRVVPGLLTPAVRSLFTKSGLAVGPEGNSAAEYVDHGARVTKVGEGGIGRNAESVPMSSRDFSPGQFPFLDLIKTSESSSVGVDLRSAFGTRIGSDRKIYAPLLDRRTGKIVYRNPQDTHDAVVAVPGAMASRNPVVEVIRKGKLDYAPRRDVDYIVPSMEQGFSPLTNMVPLKSASKAHRPSMGARYIAQSLPLSNPEAPLVRTQVPNQPGVSFEELYGRHMGPVYADKRPGVVKDVTPDSMTVQYADGSEKKHELYNAFPTGRKTALESVPMLRPGDPVAPGQMLARSNYTDAKGHAAYGANLRLAFMLGKGDVFEDSAVVSQSAAKRLTSDHLFTHTVEPDEHTMIGKAAHAAAFGGKHSLETLKTVGDDGVVKPGTVLKYGDPVILAVRRKIGEYGRLARAGRAGLSDVSETWDHHEPGTVADVVPSTHGPVVTVRAAKPLQTGDKISGHHGNKGIVVVWPDHKMPVGEDGKPIDAIFSSLGTVSRANPSAVYSSILGKIAAKTGKPYVVSDFDDVGDERNIGRWVADEARKNGVKFKENLADPETGRTIPGVGVGTLYVMKLLHMAELKNKARGLGGYDETGQPLRGQSGRAMRASLGDTNALISHGATNTIFDDHLMKGAANEDFWHQFMQGYPPIKPNQSPAFERYLTELRAAGLDPQRKDGRYHLMALTNSRVHELAGDRVLQNGETLDLAKNGEPIPGGLFSPDLFGSSDSRATWARIPLHTPMLNPAMEGPARRLLGLTERQFRDTIAGKHELPQGTGPQAIATALGSIDVPKESAKTRKQAESSRKTLRDEANRKLIYLKGLEKTGQSPSDWILDSVPVLPPQFRPVRPGGPHGEAIVHDANLLYSELHNANSALKDLSHVTHDTGAETLNVYDAMKAVVGLGDPISAKNRERGVKGVLGRLLGDSSKRSFLQLKLLGTPINLSARAQAVPNPELDMDEVGVPEKLAWEMYHPFIVRRLVRGGLSAIEAARAVEEKSKVARDHLLDEMGERPIRVTRYPALHRYATAGFRPVLTPGDSIQINHMVVKPYGADYDGDAYTMSVPLSDAAVKETYDKLLPSANLFSPAGRRATPYNLTAEYAAGIHEASTADQGGTPIEFPTATAARSAYASGHPGLGMGTRVRVPGDG